MPWDQLGIYLYNHSCQVMPVRGDGFCFLNVIDLALYCDYNEVVSVNSLESNTLGYLAANVDYYKQFHAGDILRDAEGFFKFGNNCDSVVDLLIISTAKALNLNLSSYQKGPDGNIQVIEQTTENRGREVHLKFMRIPIIQLKTTMMPFCCLTNLVRYAIIMKITLRIPAPPACSQSCKMMHMR